MARTPRKRPTPTEPRKQYPLGVAVGGGALFAAKEIFGESIVRAWDWALGRLDLDGRAMIASANNFWAGAAAVFLMWLAYEVWLWRRANGWSWPQLGGQLLSIPRNRPVGAGLLFTLLLILVGASVWDMARPTTASALPAAASAMEQGLVIDCKDGIAPAGRSIAIVRLSDDAPRSFDIEDRRALPRPVQAGVCTVTNLGAVAVEHVSIQPNVYWARDADTSYKPSKVLARLVTADIVEPGPRGVREFYLVGDFPEPTVIKFGGKAWVGLDRRDYVTLKSNPTSGYRLR